MGEHLIDGEFQSDRYPTTPRGKVPLSTGDPLAQDLLHEYAQRRRKIDGGFSADLEEALRLKGYHSPVPPRDAVPVVCRGCFYLLGCERKTVHVSFDKPWFCHVCEREQLSIAEVYVVGARDVALFAAAVGPMAMQMATYLLRLGDASYDEPGLPDYLTWDAITEHLRTAMANARSSRRCDECDPSYGCFDGTAPCSKSSPHESQPSLREHGATIADLHAEVGRPRDAIELELAVLSMNVDSQKDDA